MMLKRLLDAKTTQKTHKSECVTDRPTDRPTDHTVEYRVAFTRLKSCLAISKQFLSPKMIKKEKQKSEKRERLTEAVQKMKLMLSGLRGVSRVT